MSTSSWIVDGRQGDSRLIFDCSLPGDTLVSGTRSSGEKRKRKKGNRSGRVNSGIDPNNNELRPVQPGNPSTLPTANSIDRPRATRTFGASVQSSKSYVTHQSSLLLFLLLVLPLNVFSWGRSQHNSAFSIKSIRTINRNSPLTFLWKGTRPSPIQMSQNQPDNSKSIRVLGVCGGIGSGKSMACKLLVSELGCISHIEADSIAHTVYKPGSQAVQDVVNHFGTGILVPGGNPGEEEIDRKKLGAIVFSDPEAMKKLEHIVWPHVKTEIFDRIEAIKKEGLTPGEDNKEGDDDNKQQKTPVIVVEAAVLLDAGWEDFLDGVWVVTAPPKVAVGRLVEYRSFAAEDAEKRIEAQKSRRGIGNIDEEVRNGVVNAIIENRGGLEELKATLMASLNDEKCWKQS